MKVTSTSKTKVTEHHSSVLACPHVDQSLLEGQQGRGRSTTDSTVGFIEMPLEARQMQDARRCAPLTTCPVQQREDYCPGDRRGRAGQVCDCGCGRTCQAWTDRSDQTVPMDKTIRAHLLSVQCPAVVTRLPLSSCEDITLIRILGQCRPRGPRTFISWCTPRTQNFWVWSNLFNVLIKYY